MRNKKWYIMIPALMAGILMVQQCKVVKEVIVEEPVIRLSGLEGLKSECSCVDTIENIQISKAESVIKVDDQRYEAQVSLFAIKDSVVYISAVNNGFEIIRALVDRDSIKVIDRINKVVYHSPLKRKFGYSHPVNFKDMQNLISHYFMCDNLDAATGSDKDKIEFDFDEDKKRKRITLKSENFRMLMFEFVHTITHRYIVGEATDEGFKIYSNLVIGDVEILTHGGRMLFNQEVKVKMSVNPRRYSYINF